MASIFPILFDKLSSCSKRSHHFDWREILSRDIENLLNNASHSATLKLEHYSECDLSVLNFGFPSLSKRMPINLDPMILAKHINRILTTFEPRLDPSTIKVLPVVDIDQQYVLALLFDISAKSRLPDDNHIINLRIALDYSCGTVHVF